MAEAVEKVARRRRRPGRPGDGIPPLAQLKLLRDLQKDINQRTETFKNQHPDPKKLRREGQGRTENPFATISRTWPS